MKAERTKRANILDAEGFRQAEIEKAEGEKRAVVLAAEGKAEAIRQVADAQKYEKLTLAQGEAEAIATVYNAIHAGKPTNDLIAIKYLETLGQMADGKATKIFLPLEASGVLGTLGGMAELLKTQQEAAVAEKAPTQPK